MTNGPQDAELPPLAAFHAAICGPQDAELPPADPSEFPPELREALARMSLRGRVIDQATGAVVAEDGRMVDEPDNDEQPS